MDFPPRGGGSREGGGDDLEIDFEPLRTPRVEPPGRGRRPQPKRRPTRRRARRRPTPEGEPRRRGPRSETVARVLWVVPWIVFVVAVVAAGGILFAIAMAALACIGLAELFRMTSNVHPFRLVGFAAAIGVVAAAYYGGQ